MKMIKPPSLGEVSAILLMLLMAASALCALAYNFRGPPWQ